MTTRKILLIIGSICAAVILAGAISFWLLYKFVTRPIAGYEAPQIPAKLKDPRVVVGQGFLSRSVFVETGLTKPVKEIGGFSDVKVGEFDAHPGLDVVVAGTEGAYVFDRGGVRQSYTLFHFPIIAEKLGPFSSPNIDDVMGQRQVVDLEGDGICEYIARGSIDGAAVFDHAGALLWTYGKFTKEKTSIDDLTVGDLNGDGVAEFVVSWNGIEVYDKSGKQRAQVVEEYGASPIEVVDTDGDGKNEIVSVSTDVKIRNAAGEIISEVPAPGYIGHFAITTPPGKKEPVMLTVYDSKLLLIDFNGDIVANFDAPLSEFADTAHKLPDGNFYSGTSVFRSRGVWIKLANDQPEYLAVINEFAAIDRAVLAVYTPTGQLVYQEVMPEGCTSIAVLPPADAAGVAELLIAGEQTVWRYRIN